MPDPDSPTATDPTTRLRIAAVAAYVFAATISLFWGLSYDLFYDHGLLGEVRAGATSEGSTFVTVHNGSQADWTNVKIEADDHWYLRLAVVPAGSQQDFRLREFRNAYRLPRAHGVFLWEGVGGAPEPDMAPANLRPSVVRVTTDTGEFSTEVSF